MNRTTGRLLGLALALLITTGCVQPRLERGMQEGCSDGTSEGQSRASTDGSACDDPNPTPPTPWVLFRSQPYETGYRAEYARCYREAYQAAYDETLDWGCDSGDSGL